MPKEHIWNLDAKKSAISQHKKAIEGGILYYMNRGRTDKVIKLKAELESLKKFYNL